MHGVDDDGQRLDDHGGRVADALGDLEEHILVGADILGDAAGTVDADEAQGVAHMGVAAAAGQAVAAAEQREACLLYTAPAAPPAPGLPARLP